MADDISPRMDEVHVCGILQSKNKPKKGYIEVSGVTYWCAEWTEPYVARQTIGDVVDIIYKVGKNGGKTLVSIRKARDPSKAVQGPTVIPQEVPPFKRASEIKEETTPAPPQQQTTCTSPSPVAAPVAMWSSPATIDIEVTVNLDNYENIRVRVSGSSADRDKLVNLLNDTLGQFGRRDEPTRERIDAYRRRVIS